jgi:hypothetical protein
VRKIFVFLFFTSKEWITFRCFGSMFIETGSKLFWGSLIRIRIPYPEFWCPEIWKFTVEKICKLCYKNYRIYRTYKGSYEGQPSSRRSLLQLSRDNFQLFKTWNFRFLLLFFGLFAFLDPDPRTQLNPEPSGLRIRTPRITICVKYIFIGDGDNLLERKPLLQEVQFACDLDNS